MKITAIDACVLTVPTPKPMALEFPHHKLVVAEISTDDGVRRVGIAGMAPSALRTWISSGTKSP